MNSLRTRTAGDAPSLPGGVGRDLGLALERDGHFGADEPGEVRDHFIGDAACVAAEAGRVGAAGSSSGWPVDSPSLLDVSGLERSGTGVLRCLLERRLVPR